MAVTLAKIIRVGANRVLTKFLSQYIFVNHTVVPCHGSMINGRGGMSIRYTDETLKYVDVQKIKNLSILVLMCSSQLTLFQKQGKEGKTEY